MLVEIDAGNSRLKWRLRDREAVLACGVESGLQEAALESIATAQLALGGVIDCVSVVSVRDRAARDALARQVEHRLHIVPRFAVVSAGCAGITNSYTEPQLMGVDRWSAMIAAMQKLDAAKRSSAFCVVDAGSAMTLDFVDEGGRHCGGYIVPGLSLQIASLLQATGQVALHEATEGQQLLPADNTTDAVQNGVMLSMVQLLQYSVRRFSGEIDSSVEVFATGGDAEILLKYSDLSLWLCPDLVLDGVQYLLP